MPARDGQAAESSADAGVVVEVPMPVWMTTYATLDNVSSVEREGGDEELAAHAEDLMDRGSQAAADHPQARQGWGGWPPRDATLQIELSAADMQLIREALRTGIETSRLLLTDYPLNEEERGEQVASLTLGEEAIAFWG